MTEEQKIAALRTLLDGNTEDVEVLSVFLEEACARSRNRMYPYVTDYTGLKVPDRYAYKQVQISAYLMLKRGAEFEVQHIENGTHRNYGSADIPEELFADIAPKIGVVR